MKQGYMRVASQNNDTINTSVKDDWMFYTSDSSQAILMSIGSNSVKPNISINQNTLATTNNIFLDGSSNIEGSSNVNLIANGNVIFHSSILPSQNSVFDLGSSNMRFKSMYLAGQTLHIGDYQFTTDTSSSNMKLLNTIENRLAKLQVEEIQLIPPNSTNVISVIKADPTTGDLTIVSGTTTNDGNFVQNATQNSLFSFVNASNLSCTGTIETSNITAYDLQVPGTSYFNMSYTSNSIVNTLYLDSNDSAVLPSLTWTGDDDTGIFHHDTNTIGVTTNGSVKMVIGSNIGVGTTFPKTSLHLNGGPLFTERTTSSPPVANTYGGLGDRVILSPGTDTQHPFSIGMDNNILWHSVPDIGTHKWYVTGNEIMRISTSGIGIGNPPALQGYLHVDNNINGVSIYTKYDIASFSDARYKTNLRVIDNALDKIQQICGYTYERTDDPTAKRVAGVLAQEVSRVLPEVVSVDEHGKHSVCYGNMVSLLIQCIKELKHEVDSLRQYVN